MSRGRQSFKQSELTKAIKAAEKAGVKDWIAEIADGKIRVFARRPDDSEQNGQTPSEWD
jgi:hypothetical protein